MKFGLRTRLTAGIDAAFDRIDELPANSPEAVRCDRPPRGSEAGDDKAAIPRLRDCIHMGLEAGNQYFPIDDDGLTVTAAGCQRDGGGGTHAKTPWRLQFADAPDTPSLFGSGFYGDNFAPLS